MARKNALIIKDVFVVGTVPGQQGNEVKVEALVLSAVGEAAKVYGLSFIRLANRFGGDRSRDVFIARWLDGSRILVAGRDANSPYVAPERVFFQTAIGLRDRGHEVHLFCQEFRMPVPAGISIHRVPGSAARVD